MHKTSRITLLALVLAALLLPGCGQPITRAEWEDAHPSSQPIDVTEVMPTDRAAGLVVVVYPDAIPRIDPVTGAYHVDRGVHVVRYRDGQVVDRRWQLNRTLAP